VTTQQPAVKKYIVKLSDDERERLSALIQKGKAPVRQVLKARIRNRGKSPGHCHVRPAGRDSG
jgi:hypothetical protein